MHLLTTDPSMAQSSIGMEAAVESTVDQTIAAVLDGFVVTIFSIHLEFKLK